MRLASDDNMHTKHKHIIHTHTRTNHNYQQQIFYGLKITGDQME